jgi:hypothetical protein
MRINGVYQSVAISNLFEWDPGVEAASSRTE